MTLAEERAILEAAYKVVDSVGTLHLSGGGEPFLHPQLAEMTDLAFEYESRFDRLMLFTNSTVPISGSLLEALKRHRKKIIVHASDYGAAPERTAEIYRQLEDNAVPVRVIKYHGDTQDFGGWVDFGKWEPYNRPAGELARIFKNCAVTRDMGGNWRTRDGKVHWCSRSQRGMELGLIPDNPGEYVDLFGDSLSLEQKRAKFLSIANTPYLTSCDHCSGEQGTSDTAKRYKAAEQL
jgi:hypothetical protein